MAIKKIQIIPPDGGYVDVLHPETSASQVIEETNKRFLTDAERSKLASIAASANNYVHPTTAGNKHIPTGGAANNFLQWSSSGVPVWSTIVPAEVGLGNVSNLAQMPIAGGTFTGVAKAQNNTSYTTAQLRNVIQSTANPSGGSNGDIWIKYV